MIQENWDESVQNDVGPQETIPVVDRKMGLSTWQNIFLCEFDGPRTTRQIMVTVLKAD